jgi:hypothetical protein
MYHRMLSIHVIIQVITPFYHCKVSSHFIILCNHPSYHMLYPMIIPCYLPVLSPHVIHILSSHVSPHGIIHVILCYHSKVKTAFIFIIHENYTQLPKIFKLVNIILKRQYHEIFDFWFFHNLINTLKYFWILFWICEASRL